MDKENTSPYASMYKRRRSVKNPQAFVETRSFARRLTVRTLFVMIGMLMPWIGFPVFMIIKDHRPVDSKFMLGGTVLGIVYLLFYVLGIMILLDPGW